MKIPSAPPPLGLLTEKIGPQRLLRLLGMDPLQQGRYLHWDELRHRTAPPGLDHESWWLGIKIARRALSRSLPLIDKQGRPIRFAAPDPMLLALHRIDRHAAAEKAIDHPMLSGEGRNRYLFNSLIEEAITSSQLEGASTTREVAADMLRSGRKPRDRSERMILNNYRVMDQVRSLRDQPFTVERILKLHRIATEGTLDQPDAAGRFRHAEERVSVMDATQTVVLHVPPDADSLPERLERLCAFANQAPTDEPFVHPMVRAVVVHFMLGYDHPFVDGNGRTARAMFYWSAARSGYWLMEYVSISRLLRKAPASYARAYLYTETDDNDATYFIIHQLDIINKAIEALQDYLKRKTGEQRNVESLLRQAPRLADQLNQRQVAMLSHALRHPGHGYTVKSHQQSHRITTQTARTDLQKLASLGLLQQRKRGRAFVFVAWTDLIERLRAAE